MRSIVQALHRWLRGLRVGRPQPPVTSEPDRFARRRQVAEEQLRNRLRSTSSRETAQTIALGLGPVPPLRSAVPPADPFEPRWVTTVRLILSGRAPEGMTVADSLCLAWLRLRSLPAGLTVDGSLDLRQCERLRRIGAGLRVAGDLAIGGRVGQEDLPTDRIWDLAFRLGSSVPSLARPSREGQCPLVALPEGLRVGGALRLRQCRALVRLPSDMAVGGSIHLEGCTALAGLPDGLHVRGDLTVKSAPHLTTLPSGLRVEGSLRLVGVRLASLPGDLSLGGDLVVECCPRLTALPEGLTVGGSLTIRRCPIAELPAGLRVGADLTLDRLASLASLPDDLAVPGTVRVDRCPQVTRLGPSLRVGGGLTVRHSARFAGLPEGLHIPGALDLRGCVSLSSLPGGLRVATRPLATPFTPALSVVDCPALGALPADIAVGGPIEVAGSGLRDLPEVLMRSARILWRGVVVPPAVVFRPESLTPETIFSQRNAELRRVMIERVGLDTLLARARATVVDHDTDPGGPRRLVEVQPEGQRGSGRPARYLHCRCPSTGRDYLLRVPPTTATCPQAAAWLAGFDDPAAYRPVQET